MRLLFIVPRFHINLYYRLKALTQAGYKVDVGVVYRGGSERTDEFTPEVLGHMFFYRLITAFFHSLGVIDSHSYRWQVEYGIVSPWKVYRHIRRTDPDIVFIRANKSLFTLSALFFVRLAGKRIMLLAQTNKHDQGTTKKQYFLYVLKEVFGVERIISPVENKYQETDSMYAYVPFSIDLSEYKETIPSTDGTVRIISVGKFQKRKDHLTLLRAITSMHQKGQPVHVTIVGGSHDSSIEQQIESYIEDNELGQLVQVYRDLSHNEIRDLYQNHDIFVLPSYNEPAAFSPLEAMASGLPVIVSDSCGTKNYIQEGENGFVFHAGDENDLQQKIDQVIAKGCDSMGKRSRVVAEEHHSLSVYAEKMKNIIEQTHI